MIIFLVDLSTLCNIYEFVYCSLQDHAYEEIKKRSGSGDAEANKMQADIEDADDEESNCCLQKIESSQEALEIFFNNHGTTIKYAVGLICLLGYGAYFAYAMSRG